MCAIYRKRVTIMVKDIRLVQWLYKSMTRYSGPGTNDTPSV